MLRWLGTSCSPSCLREISNRLIMGCTFGSSCRLESHIQPHSVDISRKVREELKIVLLKYVIFGGKSPEKLGQKGHILLDESMGVFVGPTGGCRSRCLRGKDAAPLLELLPRQALVYIADPLHRGLLQKMPLKSLNTWYLSIFFQFRSIPKYPRNIPGILQTWVPQIHWLIILFPGRWAQLVG